MNQTDKEIEKSRYNTISQKRISEDKNILDYLRILGSDNFNHYIGFPYVLYEEQIKKNIVKNECNLLDLCCGDGMHSFTGYNAGATVIALDYSESSIKLAEKRAEANNCLIDFQICDVESLPFPDESFEIVTCAGSLSYIDHNIFIKEVKRVLKPGGKFIVIDSFNHNIFYRLNRYLHFIKGNRTFSTLTRMPNYKLLKFIKHEFQVIEVQYYGIFLFAVPFLKLFLGSKKISVLISRLDNFFSFLKKYSFKIIMVAVK